MINVSDELQELSDIFARNGEKLYVVGGFVRDQIMGLVSAEHNDIDLASACKPAKVVKILSKAGYETDDRNSEYGTVIIKGQKRYEYTTFRRDNYNMNGEHNPTGVEFVKDIKEDALRRDFTINAIYYDIDRKEIVDPVYGQEDIKNKLIKCPGSAEISFKEDAERILRLIRFINTFNYETTERTLDAVLEYRKGIGNLSKNRIRAEFDKMLVCDTYYPQNKESKYAHAKCLLMIDQLGLWQYILPAIGEISNMNIHDDKGEVIYNHLINTVSICAPEVRLACLLHDVGKVYTKSHTNSFNFSKEWADIIIEDNLGQEGLLYPKETIEKIKRIVAALDFDRHGFESKKAVRRFIVNNWNDFDEICMLKDAISLENTDYTKKSVIAQRWQVIKRKMEKFQTPISIKELNIDGNDIIDAVPSIRLEKINKLQNKLLDYCLDHPKCNDKQTLKTLAYKFANKNPEEYYD